MLDSRSACYQLFKSDFFGPCVEPYQIEVGHCGQLSNYERVCLIYSNKLKSKIQ